MVEKFSTTKETAKKLSRAGAKSAKSFVKLHNRRRWRRIAQADLRHAVKSGNYPNAIVHSGGIDYRDVL